MFFFLLLLSTYWRADGSARSLKLCTTSLLNANGPDRITKPILALLDSLMHHLIMHPPLTYQLCYAKPRYYADVAYYIKVCLTNTIVPRTLLCTVLGSIYMPYYQVGISNKVLVSKIIYNPGEHIYLFKALWGHRLGNWLG